MSKSFFLDYFPPPKYLQMPSVGLDISDCSFKFIELKKRNGVYVVSRFGSKTIPAGMIESGEIKDREKLISFLRQAREEFKINRVVIGLPEEKSYLSRIKLPLMERKEIRGVLELQMEEHIPMTPSEAIFDYEIDDQICKEHLDVNLIAFPRKLVEEYLDVLTSAGFMPTAFETESGAITRSLVPAHDVSTRNSNLIIDFGKTRTTFVITGGDKIQFTSSVQISGVNLENILMRTMKVDVVRADKIKKEKGFIKNEPNMDVYEALFPIMSALKDEAAKLVNYWNSHIQTEHHSPSGAITKVLLCGGDANLFGLSEYLSGELGIPAEKGNPWVNLFSFDDYIPELEARESLMYSTAIGLAMRGINLQI